MINLKLIESMVANGTISEDQAITIRNAARENAAGPTNYDVVEGENGYEIANVGENNGSYTFKQAKGRLRELLTEQTAEAKTAWQGFRQRLQDLPGLRKAEIDALGVQEVVTDETVDAPAQEA